VEYLGIREHCPQDWLHLNRPENLAVKKVGHVNTEKWHIKWIIVLFSIRFILKFKKVMIVNSNTS
jgi:desulfoferrodoxin (superoxide reductase-like protein)